MEVTVICFYVMHCTHYLYNNTSSRFGFWDILSKGLGSVTMSQSRLITLSWAWLFQISQKPHPIIINIVKVLQCHQISTFWCVINSSACTIDEWKYKSIAEKIVHNSAKCGCHFYEKFDSLSYTVKIEPDLEYFMESAGIRYFTHKLLTYQKSYKYKNKCLYTIQSTFHVLLC